MPNPQKPSATDAISGAKNSQWGEMEGIVHPMHTDEEGDLSFHLYTSIGLVQVHTPFLASEAHLERID